MNNKSNIEQSIKRNYGNIVDIVLCICLFVMAIYKGSFYKQDMLFPNIVVTIIGAGYVLIRLFKEVFSKRDKKIQKEPLIHNILGLLIIALPVAYALPIVFKKYSSLSNSIYEMLRYIDFCIIYYIVKKSNVQGIYIKCIVFISGVLTILGIDQMTYRFFEPILNKLSTGYLYEDRNRLSSTIQYANITGIIILLGYIFISRKIQQLLENSRNNKEDGEKANVNLFEKIKDVIYVYLLVALSTIQVIAIILTNSRTVIFLLCLFNLYIFIYHIIKKRKAIALITACLFISGVIFSGDIILNITSGSYISVFKYIIVACALSAILVYILTNNKVIVWLNRLKDKLLILNKPNKIVIRVIAIIIVVLLIYSVSISKPLRIKLNESNSKIEKEDWVKISNDLQGFKVGDNKLEIVLSQNELDSRYTINIVGVTEKNKTEVLGTINHSDKTDTKYLKEFKIYGGISRIVLDIELKKGDITFDTVKLNNKNQKLAYVFLPERVLSKFKETLEGDNSSKLRHAYLLDSIKIWKESKIFGFGGEAFKYKYSKVQSYPYISTEAHSCLLQTLVEAGIIGFIVITGIIGIVIYMSLCLITRNVKEKNIYLFFSIISILTICIFDLALSFGIMIYILAILIGIISKQYSDSCECKLVNNDSYFKIAILSFAIVCLVPAINFSMNIYRSSLLVVPTRAETLTSEEYISDIELLNKKILLDKYDTKNITAVISKYEEYKQALSSVYYSVEDDSKREFIKSEITNSVKKIKENTDVLVNNEYGDKYILEVAAKTYFSNFMNFANIYENQFKDKEIAYAFYLGYALKLTDRIYEIAPYSSKSKEMANDIYEFYLEELTRQNDIIQSQSIANICTLLEKRIQDINK